MREPNPCDWREISGSKTSRENGDIKCLAAWFCPVVSSSRKQPMLGSAVSSVSSVEIHGAGAQTPTLSEVPPGLTTKQERGIKTKLNITKQIHSGFISVPHLEGVFTGFIQIIQRGCSFHAGETRGKNNNI